MSGDRRIVGARDLPRGAGGTPDPIDGGEHPRGTVLTAVATSALAAVAVLALVGVLVLVFGQRAGSGDRGSAQADERPAEPGLTPRPAAPVPGPVSGPARSGAPPRAGGTQASSGPSESKVVVLNATSRPGLAARFRRKLVGRGWNVVSIGNFRGDVAVTTVYYPVSQRRAAEALDAQFAEVNRARPAFPGISQSRLTVILADDVAR